MQTCISRGHSREGKEFQHGWSQVPKSFHFRLHRGIHLDERRPGAFETFARDFLRRVDAEFAAAGDFARGVVEHVGRAFGEDAVALRVGVGAEAEEDFAGVVHVHVVVHHDDVFGEHHLPHAPEAVHDFVGLHRVGLLDAHEDEVVEDALGRERDVHDLREVHLEDGQEELHGGGAHVEVLHRRDADDGGGIHGVPAVRDGGDVEDGIRLGQRVIAGVIAERAFVAQRFGGVDVAFDDEVGVGGHLQGVGLALHELNGFLAEITGEQELVEAVGQRRGGAEGEDGIATEEDGDGHALALLVIAAAVARGDFLQLPVHAGGVVVVNLDAIHADVALAGVGIVRDNAGQRDESAAIERPAFENGQIGECGWIGRRTFLPIGCRRPTRRGTGRIELVDDFLARAVAHDFGFRVAQIHRVAEQFYCLAQ